MRLRPVLAIVPFLLAAGLTPRRVKAAASVVLTPRFEDIEGSSTVARRSILRVKANGDTGPFGFYFEGFGEAESQHDPADQRRVLESPVFLQEAYLEFKKEFFYLRAGKQAMRWSDMWAVPSLDVWTARRWNRFLFDPQPEQLEHSGGVSASIALSGVTLEGAVINQPARSRYPKPLPEFLDEESPDVSGGARAKFDLGSFSGSLVGARTGMKDVAGFSMNYAFEKFVPKFEFGKVHDASQFPLGAIDDTFVAAGMDIFLGNWTLQPQGTWFDFGENSQGRKDYQTIFYLGGTWQRDKHDVQFQTFGNTATKDFYFNLFYGYNVKDWAQIGVFVQDYEGSVDSLFGLYHVATGGWVGGLRLEFNGSLSKD